MTSGRRFALLKRMLWEAQTAPGKLRGECNQHFFLFCFIFYFSSFSLSGFCGVIYAGVVPYFVGVGLF